VVCEATGRDFETPHAPNKELWQMWSLHWTENPEERDRNPSAPQKIRE
jgi:hypothetical protein